MQTLLSILPILAVLALGVVSPGPSFLLVARLAVAVSRRAALAAALGMATGAGILSVAALSGLHALFAEMPRVYAGLKLAGAAYLAWLGWKTWRGAKRPLAVADGPALAQGGLLRHYGAAAATMLTNPKAAVQYGVIFAAMLPASVPGAQQAALPPAVFVLEASWYAVVALGLSARGPRAAYLRARTAIDRTIGVVLGLLGLRLAMSAR